MPAFQESTTFSGIATGETIAGMPAEIPLLEIALQDGTGRVVTRRSLERHLFLEPLVISDALLNLP